MSYMKLLFALSLVLFSFSLNSPGQYCIGQTKFTPRDSKGRIMKKKHLRKLKVLEVDGEPRKLTDREDRVGIFYPTSKGNRSHGLYFKKRLSFVFGFCNQIRDITLGFKGVKMMLIFDIGILNSNFNIEALPFQKGTFRLKSLKCIGGKRPPRVDNENRGFCQVSSTNWEKVSDKIVPIDKECCRGKARFGYWYDK